MLILILIIIAIGILLLSEDGKAILGFLSITAIVLGTLYVLFWILAFIVVIVFDKFTAEEIGIAVGLLIAVLVSFFFFNELEKKHKDRKRKVSELNNKEISPLIKGTSASDDKQNVKVDNTPRGVQRVVMIDKDKYTLNMYKQKLIKQNIDVLDFIDYSDDALSHIIKFHPEVITCEIVSNEGVLDGFDILRSIRRSGEMIKGKSLSHTRFVFLTNQGQSHDLKQALGMGVDGYIVKAKITPDELTEFLNEVNNGVKVIVVEDTSKK